MRSENRASGHGDGWRPSAAEEVEEAPTGLRVKGLRRYRGVDQGLEGWMWVGRGQDYQVQDDPIISTGDAEIRSDKGWKYKKSS